MKWENKQVEWRHARDGDFIDFLNRHGEDGWEFTVWATTGREADDGDRNGSLDALGYPRMVYDSRLVYFKRAKQEPPKARGGMRGVGVPADNEADLDAARCRCARCMDERDERIAGLPASGMVMVLCQKCGNKRCPHATDHRHECTNSNEPGQKGSKYE